MELEKISRGQYEALVNDVGKIRTDLFFPVAAGDELNKSFKCYCAEDYENATMTGAGSVASILAYYEHIGEDVEDAVGFERTEDVQAANFVNYNTDWQLYLAASISLFNLQTAFYEDHMGHETEIGGLTHAYISAMKRLCIDLETNSLESGFDEVEEIWK